MNAPIMSLEVARGRGQRNGCQRMDRKSTKLKEYDTTTLEVQHNYIMIKVFKSDLLFRSDEETFVTKR